MKALSSRGAVCVNERGTKRTKRRQRDKETESLVFLRVELKQAAQDVQPNYFLCLAADPVCVEGEGLMSHAHTSKPFDAPGPREHLKTSVRRLTATRGRTPRFQSRTNTLRRRKKRACVGSHWLQPMAAVHAESGRSSQQSVLRSASERRASRALATPPRSSASRGRHVRDLMTDGSLIIP